MTAVYLRHLPHWHAIYSAWPGGRIVFACRAAVDYTTTLAIATAPLPESRCPACERELERLRREAEPAIEVTVAVDDWRAVTTQSGEG